MRARLTVETGTATPPVLDFSEGQTVRLGRDPASTVVLDDRFASRRHAEIYPADKGWKIRDCKSTNKTRLNGERIGQAKTLADGDLITIGDVRLRFVLNPVRDSTDEIPILLGGDPQSEPATTPAEPAGDLSETVLQVDELTALVSFLKSSQQQTTVPALVHLALAAVHRQTDATLAGFLSLDPEDPQLKIVYPGDAAVDMPLSRRLTREAVRTRRPVWLHAARTPDLVGESLLSYRDALCVPLQVPETGPHKPGAPATGSGEPPHKPGAQATGSGEPDHLGSRSAGGLATGGDALGALHVYRASRAFRYRDVHFCEVLAGCLAGALQVLRGRCVLEADVRRLRSHAASDDLVGESPALCRLRQQMDRLGDLPCTVLITGESGVGKELVALGLHRRSRRRDGPFVPVNCAALPDTLIEAELFGHKAGGFTGAETDRAGCFLKADEGTLFLDEIGEMPLNAQARLLRVLETKRVKAVGGDDEQAVDVRILAATNRDLEQAMREGRFRQDLFYRLAPVLTVPPLRDHAEDVPALVDHFLACLADEYHRRVTLSQAALSRLQTYRWPGNVRQLRNVLATAVALCDDHGAVRVSDLQLPSDAEPASGEEDSLNLEELEARTVRRALARANGVHAKAAQLLGIHRDTLLNKLKKYGLERGREQ
jgi:two-component system, NtrC family, response regulator HydG